MSEYCPDNWVVIKIITEDKPLYKVLGGWSGGYLDSDSWRMNSGINLVFEREDSIDFYGYSGSMYKCYRDQMMLRMNNAEVWYKMKEKYGDQVEIMPEDTDWSNLLNDTV